MANPSRLEKIQITGNTTSGTATKVNVQEPNGEVNTQTINTGFNKNIGLGASDIVGATTLLNQYSTTPADWVAQSYSVGAIVFYAGKQWIAKSATISSEIPATSPKWTDCTFEALANSGVTVDQTIIDGSTNPVSGNAVNDALALKQNLLTNPITGTGTANTLIKFTGATTVGNSNITDTGTLISTSTDVSINGQYAGRGINNNPSNLLYGTNPASLAGFNNALYGRDAGLASTSATGNAVYGAFAFVNNQTGDNTTVLGTQGARFIADGTTLLTVAYNGVYVGYQTRASANSVNNEIVVGQGAIGQGPNSAVFGNSSISKTVLRGRVLHGTETDNGVDIGQFNGSAIATAWKTTGGTTSQFVDGTGALQNKSQFQTALTNPITGTGTANTLIKFTGATTVGNSLISESGTIISGTGSLLKKAFSSFTTSYPTVLAGEVGFGSRGNGDIPFILARGNRSDAEMLGITGMTTTDVAKTGQSDMAFRVGLNNATETVSSLTTSGIAFSFQNGSSFLVNITRSGRTLFGTITDNGVDLVQINGSAIATAWKTTGGATTDYVTGTGSLINFNSGVRTATLTGFVSGAGTVSATDNVLQAINKLDGNINAKVSNATHTGDATGSTVLTLATVNSNVGTFGTASSIPQLTVNAKGLVTFADNLTISLPQANVVGLTSDLALKAPLASPALTGTPTAPTATAGTNTTQVATTAFVAGALSSFVPTGTVNLTGNQTVNGLKVFARTVQVTPSGNETGFWSIYDGANSSIISTVQAGGTAYQAFCNSNGSTGFVANTASGANTGDLFVGKNITTVTFRVNRFGDITGNTLNISALNTAPESATATGTLGEIRITSTHIYVCIATNTWVRSALTTW